MKIQLLILGEPSSKANSRRAIFSKGTPRFIKSKKALDYKKTFMSQIVHQMRLNCTEDGKPVPPFTCDVVVEMNIFYASRRPDLDESLILDLMQGHVYKNDRQVKQKHIYWGIDKNNPRTVIKVWEHSLWQM
tara:strand:- start:274 stop:669 length:396 start_codon:yes stop_codon:yes gene_type:complete